MKNSVVILVFILSGFVTKAQEDTHSIAVTKDPRIELLIKKQTEINELTSRESRRNVPGFRVQVINTTDRSVAIDAKTRIYKLYPEMKAYLLYQAPYFRLRVGNFLNRKDAESAQKKLSREFKQDLFIVNDIVEVNPDKSIEP